MDFGTIKIGVTTFTAKVIGVYISRSPIDITTNSLLGKAIEALPFSQMAFPFQEERTVGEVIELKTSSRIAHHFRHQRTALWSISAYLEKEALNFMCVFVEAQTRCEKSIVSALDDFYKKCGIDEDDYPRDTAVKYYYRWHNQ